MRIILFLLLFVSWNAAAAGPNLDLSHHSGNRYGATMAERVDRLSALFVGQDYVIDPLGEGPGGEFDQDPLYRLDAFDCTTYIETVMALAGSTSKDGFEQALGRIRYHRDPPSFQNRNHFPDADWRPNAIRQGFVKDVTRLVAGTLPVKEAHARIRRDKWYANLGPERVHLRASPSGQAAALSKLRALGEGIPMEKSTIPYLPFDSFFERKPNGFLIPEEVLARIPSGTIFNIVRTRFRPSDKVGTELSVWHQGLLIRKNGVLMARHATFLGAGMVVETRAVDFLLAEYLREINVGSRDHGVNFLQITAPGPAEQ